MKQVFLLLSVLIALSSCRTTEKLIEKGDYDSAINRLVKKLSGKKNKDRDDVISLEYAFKKAQSKDLQKIKDIKPALEIRDWDQIAFIYRDIENRQNRINGLIPLSSKDGYTASFDFIQTADAIKEAKREAAELYYQIAVSKLSNAEKTKDKNLAQSAYQDLSKIDQYFSQYKDKESLKQKAIELGKYYYLVKMRNNSFSIIPKQFEDELLGIYVADINSKFKQYDTKANESIAYDYYVITHINSIDISPEREKSRVYDDVYKVIKDEKVKDKYGKVKKDSLGREIIEKVEYEYTNKIEEVLQLKSVRLAGKMEFSHAKSGEITSSKPVEVEAVFENKFARIIKGDYNYVTEECRTMLNRKAIPFPTNEEMLIDAARKLKSIIKSNL